MLADRKPGETVTVLLFKRDGDLNKALTATVQSVGRKWMHVQLGDDGGRVLTVEIATGVVHDEGAWKTHPRVFPDGDAATEYLARRAAEAEVLSMLRDGWRLRLSALTHSELGTMRELLRKVKP
jgi:hypothetical protein